MKPIPKMIVGLIIEAIVFVPFLLVYLYILSVVFTYNPDIFLYKWMDYVAMITLLSIIVHFLNIVQDKISKSILTFLNLRK